MAQVKEHYVEVYAEAFGKYLKQFRIVLCSQDWTCPHCLPGKYPKPVKIGK